MARGGSIHACCAPVYYQRNRHPAFPADIGTNVAPACLGLHCISNAFITFFEERTDQHVRQPVEFVGCGMALLTGQQLYKIDRPQLLYAALAKQVATYLGVESLLIKLSLKAFLWLL